MSKILLLAVVLSALTLAACGSQYDSLVACPSPVIAPSPNTHNSLPRLPMLADKSTLVWSPDGKQIAFITHNSGRMWWEVSISIQEDVWVASLDGSNPVNLTNAGRNESFKHLSWAQNSDGYVLVFEVIHAREAGDHVVIDETNNSDGWFIFTQDGWSTKCSKQNQIP